MEILKGGMQNHSIKRIGCTFVFSLNKEKKMRITFNRFVFFTMALMLVIAACGPTPPHVSPPSDLPDLPTDLPSIPDLPSATLPPVSSGGSDEPFVFGMLLVGPYNDHGWSQAHYEAGKYVEEKLGATMIYLDKVNPADR